MLNYLGFQLGWFACVLGAAKGWFALGPAVSILLLAAHVSTIGKENRRRECGRLLTIAAFGFTLECAALAFGAYRYVGTGLLPPAWIAALYVILAATLDSSLAWVGRRMLLAIVFGFIGGPLSFRAGVGLEAAEYLGPELRANLILAVQWAVLFPVSFLISRRFGKNSKNPSLPIAA
ncbi:MAG: hypothetical protein COB53_06360 [Elusimicrobia bacterium]|nr:MAG: hypothetical protein COB53_06360 [Elusimicrobiota bacterium]